MLEHPSLVVESRGPCRAILDSNSGERIGSAVRVPRGWLRPGATAIHESPDNSLLAVTGRANWLGPTVVWDADGQTVAILRGDLLVGPGGEFLARRAGRSFVTSSSEALVTWTPSANRLLVRFAEQTDGQPFLRMALLAAALRV